MTQAAQKSSTEQQDTLVYNHIRLRGHVGKDPQQANEKAPVTFDLAVPQGKDKPKMWITVKCWAELRAVVLSNQGICKGAQVDVQGRLTCETYNDKRSYAVVATTVNAIERREKA